VCAGIGFDHAPPVSVIGRQIDRPGGQRARALVIAVVVVAVVDVAVLDVVAGVV
jgi:hypothetical protein